MYSNGSLSALNLCAGISSMTSKISRDFISEVDSGIEVLGDVLCSECKQQKSQMQDN